jgi:hypothetical protein
VRETWRYYIPDIFCPAIKDHVILWHWDAAVHPSSSLLTRVFHFFFFSLPFSSFLRVFCFRSRCRCDYYISFFSLGFFTKCAACLRAACADCGGTSTSTLCDSFKHRTGQLYMIKWYHLVYISWYSRHIHFSSRVLYLITVENVNNARHTTGEGQSTS